MSDKGADMKTGVLSLRSGLNVIHSAGRAIKLFHFPMEWFLYIPCA